MKFWKIGSLVVVFAGFAALIGFGIKTYTQSPKADPLATGVPSQDKYDDLILSVSAKYNYPDPLSIKAQINVESNFDPVSISKDTPCGIYPGWTFDESRSYGLGNITPACNPEFLDLLSNGHPNFETSKTSTLWLTSLFNPEYNIDRMIGTLASDYNSMKLSYPSCIVPIILIKTTLAAYNSGFGAITGCGQYNDRAQAYITLVTEAYNAMVSQGAERYLL